jgi:hypothetical protein
VSTVFYVVEQRVKTQYSSQSPQYNHNKQLAYNPVPVVTRSNSLKIE